MLWLLVVVVVLAVGLVAMWRLDRKRKFGGGSPSGDDERRAAESTFDSERWKNGPGRIGP